MANHLSFAIRTGSLATLITLGAQPAWASGFRLPELSIAGLGTSNALVANENLLGAVPYNPAAMSFHDGTAVLAGAILIRPDLSVTAEGGSATDSSGRDNLLVPNAAFMATLNEHWSWGLMINAPFGLETVWRPGTFPQFAAFGNPEVEGMHPDHSEIEMLNFNPNFAYRMNENTSLAFGLDFYRVRSVALSTHGNALGGSGNGIGFNLAALHTQGSWSFGAAYRSSVDVDIDGAVGPLPAEAEFTFPWMLQVGAKYQPSATWALEFDVERTGWSDFDRIVIDVKVPGALPGDKIVSTNNWDDANAYRLGGIFNINDRTQLRLGYTLDETGQNERYFSARVPDADRQLFSIGVAQELAGWTLEAAYMHVKFDDRTINRPAGSFGGELVAAAGEGRVPDPNGTDAYNGEYESEVNLFGIGVTRRF